ncbi:MAG: HAD hydrolase family protein [Candidatus Pseudobacter hemicellulosilyticus]|uniref:HAD hydrolase family protein n=1 Tax=Candidatus Pseudobacter hemicellulosilyticus TaxID=3121375 RepID=A0AAJ6BG56_9BACT|nr:MAG: HAD hydrolase family protein [Pseudobacter sp.]
MTLLDQFKAVTTFVFDMDGVLTDGSLLILDNGQFIRKMNIKDGFALQLAVKRGYRVAVISGSVSDPAILRLNHLGIKDVFMGISNKKAKLAAYMEEHGLQPGEVLFMGDDIPDYAVMTSISMPCAPADAVPEIKQIARYISPHNGGAGCVRDVVEKVLKLNQHWEVVTDIASR